MPPGEDQDGSVDVQHHFTYREVAGTDLCQGDVLRKTPELLGILKQAHRHYLDATYSHFIVLTQTCDLVRRKGKCKSRYVTLAVVRPLSLVVEREIAAGQDAFERTAGVADKQLKGRLRQFMERLLNNNEPEYFYLHEDAGFGFPESSCAFLRLVISLRAYEHYEVLLAARVMSLTEGFQAELGWMIGNLYSRVGTEDWVPAIYKSAKDFGKHIGDILDQSCTWVDSEKLSEAKRTNPRKLTRVTEARRLWLREHVLKTQVASPRERAIASVLRVLREIGVDDEGKLRLLQRSLRSDPEFKASTSQKPQGGGDDEGE